MNLKAMGEEILKSSQILCVHKMSGIHSTSTECINDEECLKSHLRTNGSLVLGSTAFTYSCCSVKWNFCVPKELALAYCGQSLGWLERV